jgi:hypothetical protein
MQEHVHYRQAVISPANQKSIVALLLLSGLFANAQTGDQENVLR